MQWHQLDHFAPDRYPRQRLITQLLNELVTAIYYLTVLLTVFVDAAVAINNGFSATVLEKN